MTFLLSRVLCIVVICAVLFAPKLTRAELDEKQRSPVVQTECGVVVGKIETLPHGKSVHEYLGIPYTEPPVGELRFAAPKPAKPWSGTKDATVFGSSCPQPITHLIEATSKSGLGLLFFLKTWFKTRHWFQFRFTRIIGQRRKSERL